MCVVWWLLYWVSLFPEEFPLERWTAEERGPVYRAQAWKTALLIWLPCVVSYETQKTLAEHWSPKEQLCVCDCDFIPYRALAFGTLHKENKQRSWHSSETWLLIFVQIKAPFSTSHACPLNEWRYVTKCVREIPLPGSEWVPLPQEGSDPTWTSGSLP